MLKAYPSLAKLPLTPASCMATISAPSCRFATTVKFSSKIMNKKISYLLPAILALLFFVCSCTRNNGNIGKQFGQWKVTSITVNGKEDSAYTGNMFWSFQSSTVEMKTVSENHETVTTFGNYRIMDDTLFITFPDEDRPPLPGLGLKQYAENAIQIVKLSGSQMVLAYNTDSWDADEGIAANVILQLTKW